MKCAYHLMLFFIISKCSLSQNDTLFFRHYTTDNGLSHHNVTSIIQDSLGFMWYGTEEGLNKFDGYSFIPFKHDSKNVNSLVSDNVTCLAVEKSGIIWIGTQNKGLNRYNPYTHKFDLFQHNKNNSGLSCNNITCLFVDSINKLVWIGTTNGLNIYDQNKKEFSGFKHSDKPNSIGSNAITCIKGDKKGRIWIGTLNGGLNLVSKDLKTFKTYVNRLSSNSVNDLFIDKALNVWMATSCGLNKLDPETDSLRVFHHKEKDKYSLISDNLTSVYEDKFGKIWTGTAENGLCVYYPKLDKFFTYSQDRDVSNSLNSNKINTVSQGRSGMFWAATKDGGLNAFNPKTLKFNLMSLPLISDEKVFENIIGVTVSRSTVLVIASRHQGIYTFNLKNGVLKKIINVKPGEQIQCLAPGDGETILFSNNNDLFKLELPENNSNETVIYEKIVSINKILPQNKITSFIADKKKNKIIWIGTDKNNLISYDLTYKKFTIYKGENTEAGITCIMQRKNGEIWTGTNEGLSKLNQTSGKLMELSEDFKSDVFKNHIYQIIEDKKENIWITTAGEGIIKIKGGNKAPICYTIRDGLPGNTWNTIMEDETGNFWVGCNYGICRLTFEENKLIQCRIFDRIDGLPTTEFQEGCACKSVNGRFLFTCKKGILSFNPDSLRNNPFKPPVIISDFLLSNKKIVPGDSSGILNSCISTTKALHLTHNQNSFSFEFTAISFINAGKNKYAYKLEGFEKEWIYKNAQNRIASYTNLNPGTYTFTVKASNNDGVWNDVGTSVQIIIAAPFWRTSWFYISCLVFLLACSYLIYYIRLRNILAMHEVRNKISRDLHDQIGSTLSSISIYSEVAKRMIEEKAPEAIPIMDGLGESARSSVDSMSDIVWAVNSDNEKFLNIIERLQIIATQTLEAKNIKLEFDIPESINELKLSMTQRKNIYLILKEAINNVAKYSEAVNCSIKAIKVDKHINIRIHDDGVGFKEESNTLGGNGIINMKHRAEELNGTLQIFTERFKGTQLILDFQI